MMRVHRALPALLLALAVTPAGAQDPAPPLRLPLLVHVLRLPGGPVVDEPTVREMVARVNGLYAEAGVCFALQGVREAPRSAELRTYRDRRALSAHAAARVVNVFLVHSIFDPHTSESTARTAARFGFKPDQWLDGAHVETPGRQPASYMIVRAGAGWTTMAHELGHYLGEGHHGDPDNIMGYGADPTRFSAEQLRTFRSRARRELRTGVLRAPTAADGC